MWVGVDAEWRAVINNKGRGSRDKKVEDKEKDKDKDKEKDKDKDKDKEKDKEKDKDREVSDGKHANIQQGAATLQVCTTILLLLLLPLLHLSLAIMLLTHNNITILKSI